MTQTIIDPELLFSLIQNRPIIWNKSLENYKDKNMRAAAWREVCNILKEGFEGMEEKERRNYAKNVVKKWNQIRDSWSRSINANKKSGSASVYVKKYCYHNQLWFLKKKIETETPDSANYTEINQDNTDVENEELENSIKHNEDTEHEPSLVNENPRQENPTSGASDVPRQKLNVVDRKMMSYLDDQVKTQNSQHEDHNLSFFKSLLPSVALLNEDQILQFYGGVISLLQNIKSQNRNQWPNEQQSTCNCSYQSPQGYLTPQYVQSSASATSIQSSSQKIKSERVDCDSL